MSAIYGLYCSKSSSGLLPSCTLRKWKPRFPGQPWVCLRAEVRRPCGVSSTHSSVSSLSLCSCRTHGESSCTTRISACPRLCISGGQLPSASLFSLSVQRLTYEGVHFSSKSTDAQSHSLMQGYFQNIRAVHAADTPAPGSCHPLEDS